MDIGTVLNVNIHGEDGTCIILNKKTYYGVVEDWVGGQLFLFKYDDSDFRAEPVINLFSSIKFGKTMCYEILYGDNKVWATETNLKGARL